MSGPRPIRTTRSGLRLPMPRNLANCGRRAGTSTGLVDEGRAQPQSGGLEGKAFAASARLHPMRNVVDLGAEHRYCRRTPNVCDVLSVLAPCRKREAHEEVSEPSGHARTAHRWAVQAVAGAYGLASVKANPRSQLLIP